MPTNFARIKEFHHKFDATAEPEPQFLPRRLNYLAEEVRETHEAADELLAATPETRRQAKAHLVKELADVLYVTYGFLELLGVDADAAFAEVHRSNMSKTPSPDKKALKGEGYTPANLEPLV